MALHLLKLCVGAESLEDQIEWAERRLQTMRDEGDEVCLFHTTRMVPKRITELLDGGSLYWVIKGNIQGRQELVDIRPFTDENGIRRCKLMLADEIVPTQWQPKRAFQGWRYLKSDEAPQDLGDAGLGMPAVLRAKLSDLGLL